MCRFLLRVRQNWLSTRQMLVFLSFVDSSHEECCADSGATKHMIPDYSAFTSYRFCKNKFITLGDTTQLPIMGQGNAREVHDPLYVPDLRAPL